MKRMPSRRKGNKVIPIRPAHWEVGGERVTPEGTTFNLKMGGKEEEVYQGVCESKARLIQRWGE